AVRFAAAGAIDLVPLHAPDLDRALGLAAVLVAHAAVREPFLEVLVPMKGLPGVRHQALSSCEAGTVTTSKLTVEPAAAPCALSSIVTISVSCTTCSVSGVDGSTLTQSLTLPTWPAWSPLVILTVSPIGKSVMVAFAIDLSPSVLPPTYRRRK